MDGLGKLGATVSVAPLGAWLLPRIQLRRILWVSRFSELEFKRLLKTHSFRVAETAAAGDYVYSGPCIN